MRPRTILILLALVALALLAWGWMRRSQPPVVQFATATRETISSAVSTNGKVEPSEYAAARAETSGAVDQILVALRDRVAAGAPLVTIDAARARADVEAANARIRAAQADLSVLQAGGSSAEQSSLQAEINNAQVSLDQAKRELESVERARAKEVATQLEVDAARNEVQRLEAQIRSLEQRKGSLVSPGQREAAQARLSEAQAALDQAQLQIARSTVRAPIAGTIYEFPVKRGAYLNPGDLVASIGDLDPVHVSVYVDEPDLGRVKVGQPVTITWDAMPGRTWMGTVERMPTRIEALETRQVGEVRTIIANPDRDLLPGTNVTAVIETEVSMSAVTIPKEALLRRDTENGVYVLVGDHLEWRAVKQGVNNVNRTEVKGIDEGTQVALPYGQELADGMQVAPAMP